MPQREKHIPQRTCIACRQVKDKRDLIRLVRTPAKSVVIDETGKTQGRGAYLCKQASCWHNALNRNLLGRALKITITNDDLALLKEYASRLPEEVE